MSDRHRYRRTRATGHCDSNRSEGSESCTTRGNYARVVGVCERKVECDQTNPAFLYQVPWLQGVTGPTGPTGPNMFSARGRLEGYSHMLEQYDALSATFTPPFSNTPVVLTSISSSNPYFLERFQASISTVINNIGFTQTTKMIYGLREDFTTFDSPSNNTYTSLAKTLNEMPMFIYTLPGSVVFGVNDLTNGEGEWASQTVANLGTESPKSQLLVRGNGMPAFAVHVDGDASIIFYSSQVIDGLSQWIPTTVYSPSTTTSGIAMIIDTKGHAAIATALNNDPVYTIYYLPADNMDGTSWTTYSAVIHSEPIYPIQLLLQVTQCPGIVHNYGGVLRYTSSYSFIGNTGTWSYASLISSNPNVDYASVVAIISPTGFPTVFYKITGDDGIQLAISTTNNGDSTWNHYTIIPSLASFASDRPTLFPIILPNGNIGIMYTSEVGLEFGYANESDPGTWTTNIVDQSVPGAGYYPSAVVLENGYLAYMYTCYDTEGTIVFGRSAILNEMRMMESNAYNVNWAATNAS